MCGRYYVDDETAREIEKLVGRIDRNRKENQNNNRIEPVSRDIYPADIHPTEQALVFADMKGMLSCEQQRWGFSGFRKNQVIFNARCESAMEKPTFREGILHRRIVVPAAGFYEWSRAKEKNMFSQKEEPVLFMAGCCSSFEDEEHFVILTTEANASMQPVHDRMPLILEREEIDDWIFDSCKTEEILHKTPGPLERKTDYEQLRMF